MNEPERLKENMMYVLATIKNLDEAGELKIFPTAERLKALCIATIGMVNYQPDIYADIFKNDTAEIQRVTEFQLKFREVAQAMVDEYYKEILKEYPSMAELLKETK